MASANDRDLLRGLPGGDGPNSTTTATAVTAVREVSPPPRKRKRSNESRPAGHQGREESKLTVFSWNVNGIEPLLQRTIGSFFDPALKAPCSPIRGFLKRHRWPDIVCLQEVKIKPTDLQTRRALEKAVSNEARSGEPSYLVKVCLPQEKHSAGNFGGKMYGVATIIREDLCSELADCREVSWDREGRVLILEMKYRLAVLNVYAVNGTDNPYKDPETGLVRGTRHDRKLKFHQKLLQECLSLERAGFGVLLVGDMNVAPSPLDGCPNLRTQPHQHVLNRADFNAKFFTSDDGLQAIDVFRYFHAGTRKYTYHPRNQEWGSSCDRVDLLIASKALVCEPGVLVSTDILDSPRERASSDHVPLYVVLDKGALSKQWQLRLPHDEQRKDIR